MDKQLNKEEFIGFCDATGRDKTVIKHPQKRGRQIVRNCIDIDSGKFGDIVIDALRLLVDGDLYVYKGDELIYEKPDCDPLLIEMLTKWSLPKNLERQPLKKQKEICTEFHKICTMGNVKTRGNSKKNALVKYLANLTGGDLQAGEGLTNSKSVPKYDFIFYSSPKDLITELNKINASVKAGNINNSALDSKKEKILDKLLEIGEISTSEHKTLLKK